MCHVLSFQFLVSVTSWLPALRLQIGGQDARQRYFFFFGAAFLGAAFLADAFFAGLLAALASALGLSSASDGFAFFTFGSFLGSSGALNFCPLKAISVM